jgi:hypothetical protein
MPLALSFMDRLTTRMWGEIRFGGELPLGLTFALALQVVPDGFS